MEHGSAALRCDRGLRAAAKRAQPDLPHEREAPAGGCGLAAQADLLLRHGACPRISAAGVDDRANAVATRVCSNRVAVADGGRDRYMVNLCTGLCPDVSLPAGSSRRLAVCA